MELEGKQVSVALLGPLDVRLNKARVSVPGDMSAVVLATLALSAGEAVPVDRLVDRLWSERLPARVRGSLHSHVFRLRRLLGPAVIQTVASGYLLNVDPDQVDVLRFRRLVAASASAEPDQSRRLLDEALELWRGEPLAGFRSDAFHHAEVTRLTEEWLDARQRRIELDRAAGRNAHVVAELRDLISTFPLRETLWHQLIVALAGGGRQAEAIAAYHDLRRRLRDELGVDPSADLQELYQQVCTNPPAPASISPSELYGATRFETPMELPASTSRFTGRAAELAALDRILADDPLAANSPIVALVGPAGAGKSALAVHWGRSRADRFPDGQLYADFDGGDPDHPARVHSLMARFLHALGVPLSRVPPDLAGRAALFRTVTAGRRLLILADSAELSEQVRPLIPAPGSALVVTSRSQLRGLVARDGAHRITVGALDSPGAVQLLGTMLGTASVGSEADAVASLAELCARLPLALIIAAERVMRQPGLSVDRLVEELRDERSRLESLSTREDAATDLRAVFSCSYHQLDPLTARTFRLLGLGPRAADLMPSALAAIADLPVEQARLHVDRLLALHLLRGGDGPDVYAAHDLLHAYARERALEEEPPAERDAAVRRLLDWYVRSVAAAVLLLWREATLVGSLEPVPPTDRVTPLEFASPEEALRWLEAQRAALVRAAEWAASHQRQDSRAAWLLNQVTRRFLLRRGHWPDVVHLARIGLPLAERLGVASAQGDVLRDLRLAEAKLGK
jgi:DNA-binding SARP family transcriptional activator